MAERHADSYSIYLRRNYDHSPVLFQSLFISLNTLKSRFRRYSIKLDGICMCSGILFLSKRDKTFLKNSEHWFQTGPSSPHLRNWGISLSLVLCLCGTRWCKQWEPNLSHKRLWKDKNINEGISSPFLFVPLWYSFYTGLRLSSSERLTASRTYVIIRQGCIKT